MLELLGDLRELELGAGQLGATGTGPGRVPGDALHAAPVLADEPLDLRQALFDRLQRTRAGTALLACRGLGGERLAVGEQLARADLPERSDD